jgi:hypothetical protein
MANPKLAVTSLAILLTAAGASRAGEPIEVTSLDLGSCWVGEQKLPEGFSIWNVASFGADLAVVLTPWGFGDAVHAAVTEGLAREFRSFAGGPARTAVYCFTTGHYFMTYVESPTKNLCVWSRFERDAAGINRLKLLSVYPEYEAPAAGRNCWGATRRSLVVALTATASVAETIRYLKMADRYRGMIANAEELGSSGVLVVTLSQAFDFREDEAKAALESDPALVPVVSIVEFNGRVAPAGEPAELFLTEYPGYAGR